MRARGTSSHKKKGMSLKKVDDPYDGRGEPSRRKKNGVYGVK